MKKGLCPSKGILHVINDYQHGKQGGGIRNLGVVGELRGFGILETSGDGSKGWVQVLWEGGGREAGDWVTLEG